MPGMQHTRHINDERVVRQVNQAFLQAITHTDESRYFMPTTFQPHSRSVYPRDLRGPATVNALSEELTQLYHDGIDPTTVAVSRQDFPALRMELVGNADPDAIALMYNPVSRTRVTATVWPDVAPGWATFSGGSIVASESAAPAVQAGQTQSMSKRRRRRRNRRKAQGQA
jgi:hypothetical protein